jgi:YVTN family beta-propeller protein
MKTLARQTLDRHVIAALLILLTASAAIGQTRIVQTNSRADTIQLIDPVTQKVVNEIKGIPVNHGVAAAPDGSRLYFTSEGNASLDVVDSKTLQVIKRIPLTARPNNVAISKDGRQVYAAIIAAPGAIDVIDTVSLEKVKTIPHEGGVHNVYVTPDNKHIVAGSIGGRKLTVYDRETGQKQWSLFEEGVRPMTFEANPDGSTKRAFVRISLHHGFAVVDWAEKREVLRVTLPSIPEEKRMPGPYNDAPSHGIGVAPDGKTLWVTSRMNSHVYVYALPELKYLGGIEVGHDPDWVTFTPDSKYVYVANAISNDVSAIDIASRKEVARIPTPKDSSPKRNGVITIR